MPTRTRKARVTRTPSAARNASVRRVTSNTREAPEKLMRNSTREARVKLIDIARMEAAAVNMGQSAEALVGYLITHSGQSKVVRFDPAAAPVKRISTKAFFSAGPDRVYVPASVAFSSRNDAAALMAPYDAAVGGMAFVREWVYRHARNPAELGPPARTGGGPVLVVIAIVLIVLAVAAAIAAVILEIYCAQGSVKACFLAAYFGLAAKILSKSAEGVGSTGQQQQQTLSYGTNPQ